MPDVAHCVSVCHASALPSHTDDTGVLSVPVAILYMHITVSGGMECVHVSSMRHVRAEAEHSVLHGNNHAVTSTKLTVILAHCM